MSLSSVQIGAIGIWTSQLDYQPGRQAQEAAAELEQLGFGAIWFPEAAGREALTNAGLLLARTSRIVVATGTIKARGIARAYMAMYLGLANYVTNLRALGFTDDDFTNGGSNRLVDAIVAWGDIGAIIARVRAHHSAGADHVCLQALTADPRALPRQEWRELAAGLLDHRTQRREREADGLRGA